MEKKILYSIVIIIVFVIYLMQSFSSFAVDTGLGDLSAYKGDTDGSTEFQSKVKPISATIQVVGSIVSVVTLIAIGIKYMFGSIEEKAEYKKTMIPYVIGAVMVFGISNIVVFLFDIGTNIAN